MPRDLTGPEQDFGETVSMVTRALAVQRCTNALGVRHPTSRALHPTAAARVRTPETDGTPTTLKNVVLPSKVLRHREVQRARRARARRNACCPLVLCTRSRQVSGVGFLFAQKHTIDSSHLKEFEAERSSPNGMNRRAREVPQFSSVRALSSCPTRC